MTRALVLSCGGPVGVAWQSGLLAGFARGGVDLGVADYILGTSAGAVVGARLAAGVPAAELAEPFVEASPAQALRPFRASTAISAQMAALREETQTGQRNPATVRRELGALALAAPTMPEAEFLTLIAEALPGVSHSGWPSERFACAGVDAGDGAFQLWDAASGVDLLPAVAASCAAPCVFPPVAIDGRRYMDGGARSLANADLAAGHDLIVVVFVESPARPAWAQARLAEDVQMLQESGSTVVTITPEDAAAEAVADLMDLARQPPAARAGLDQGLAQAEILKAIWG